MEEKGPAPTIHELYPTLTGDQLREAEENLDQYLSLALRIYERLIADPETYAHFRTLIGTGGTLGCTTPRSKESANSSLHKEP